MMINILICDDDSAFVNTLKEKIITELSKCKMKAEIYTYLGAEEISEDVLKDCDIAFLDLDYPGKKYTGINIAQKLRKFSNDAVIIFISDYIEYAPAGYEVRAFRYILKNELATVFEDTFNQALQQLRTEKADIKIKSDGEIITIPLKDIFYMESAGHVLRIYTNSSKTNMYSCYSTLSNMEKELSDRGFLRTQKSYLVNMYHIKKMNCTEVTLDNGKNLPVSAKTYSECKKKYLFWKGRQ